MNGNQEIKKNGRIVDEDTVIASLYNDNKELTYVFIEKDGQDIYPSTTLNKQEIIEKYLNDGKKYKERIVELTTGGEYLIAEDGTQVTKQYGKTKVYIFYSDDI